MAVYSMNEDVKKVSLSQRKKEKNMKRIMHDALHYFEENGYDNTTIDQLCKEAMISNSTFFNYFGTKEKIIEMIMQDGLEDYLAFIETTWESDKEPFAKAGECLAFEAKAIGKYCHITSVFHRLAHQNEEFRELESKYNEVSAEFIERAFLESGSQCPVSRELLVDIVGGYFAHPFMELPADQVGDRILSNTREFVELLMKLR